MKTKQPKYLYRDDGERFTRQANGKYTLDSSRMAKKYEYSYEVLATYIGKSFFFTKPPTTK
jgi:hypothetical protein